MKKLLVPVKGKELSPSERRQKSENGTAVMCDVRAYLPGATFEEITPDCEGETLCRFRDGSEWWIPTDLIP